MRINIGRRLLSVRRCPGPGRRTGWSTSRCGRYRRCKKASAALQRRHKSFRYVAGKDLTERDLSFVLLAPPVVQQENITNIVIIQHDKARSASDRPATRDAQHPESGVLNSSRIYIELRKKRSASLPEFPYRRENGEGAGCFLL